MKYKNDTKLYRILKYAQLNVPFYQDVINTIVNENPDISEFELIKKLPIIKKEKYVSDIQLMLSTEYRTSDLSVEKTSGSSGQPLKIYKTETDKLRQLKETWKFRDRFYGIKPNDRFCRFSYTNQSQNDAHTSVQKNILYLNALEMSPTIMDEFTIAINEFKPSWFFTTPSSLCYYVNYLKSGKSTVTLENKFAYIELTGEKTTDKMKKYIADFFKCQVGNNYGTTETYPIALECPCGKLHLMNENVYIEIVDDNFNLINDEKTGYIVVTSYNNTAMPFIRYWLGDKVKQIKDYTCKCGIKSTVLELENVRFTEKIKLRENKYLSPIIFCLIIDKFCCQKNCDILQFEVVQKNYEIFEMKVVMQNAAKDIDVSRDLKKIAEAHLEANIGYNITVSVVISKESSLLPDINNGKLNYFKCVF